LKPTTVMQGFSGRVRKRFVFIHVCDTENGTKFSLIRIRINVSRMMTSHSLKTPEAFLSPYFYNYVF